MVDSCSVIRLASTWDNAEQRTFCAELPQRLAAAAETAVLHRGRNLLVRLETSAGEVVAKQFPPRRGLKGLFRRGCKATQAFDHATQLQELGIGTPDPLAAIRFADGSSCYVCAWISDCRSVWDLHDRIIPDSDRHCYDLGSFVGCMHIAGALHRDNTPGNILLKPDGESFDHLVVDTNRMRFGSIGLWTGIGSLVQLECEERLLEGYDWARGYAEGRAHRLFRFQALRHRLAWRLKNSTRPLRRRLGF